MDERRINLYNLRTYFFLKRIFWKTQNQGSYFVPLGQKRVMAHFEIMLLRNLPLKMKVLVFLRISSSCVSYDFKVLGFHSCMKLWNHRSKLWEAIEVAIAVPLEKY